MRPVVCTAICVTVALGPGVALVRAQHHAAPMPTPGFYNGLTPNSTIDGDASRLAGYAGLVNAEAARIGALGTFNLNRAHADAIDSSTMMAWNEYIWGCLNEENRRSLAARAERRKRLISLYNARRERIANNPVELDLMNGDALNMLLEQLSNPKIHPAILRKKGEAIPGETIQRCAFHYPSIGRTISLGRLTVRDGWPPALRGQSFAQERAAYHKAVETAMEQNLAGKLSLETFRSLQKTVEALKVKFKATSPPTQDDDFVQAKTFLDDLDEVVAPLHDQDGEAVLAGVDRYAGTTVGDAVTFLQRFNLRFAPALTPDERESYHLLYATMLHLRNRIDLAGGARDEIDEAPALFAPSEQKNQPVSGPPSAVRAQGSSEKRRSNP
jgi:hypothetical protein